MGGRVIFRTREFPANNAYLFFPSILKAGSDFAEAHGVGDFTSFVWPNPIITDPVSTTISSATVKIANGSNAAVSGDLLFLNGAQSGTVSGVTISWNAATSTLTLTGTASIATYQTLLGQVTYQDTGADNSSGAHPVQALHHLLLPPLVRRVAVTVGDPQQGGGGQRRHRFAGVTQQPVTMGAGRSAP